MAIQMHHVVATIGFYVGASLTSKFLKKRGEKVEAEKIKEIVEEKILSKKSEHVEEVKTSTEVFNELYNKAHENTLKNITLIKTAEVYNERMENGLSVDDDLIEEIVSKMINTNSAEFIDMLTQEHYRLLSNHARDNK